MGRSVFCWLSILATVTLTAGDLNVLTGIRNDTPWGQFLIKASKTASAGQFAEAAAGYDSAVRLITGTKREDRLDLAFGLNGLGSCKARLGRPQEAEPLFKRALAIWKDLLGPGDVMVAVALNNLSEGYTVLGKHEAARRAQLEALKIDEAALGSTAPLVANDWNNLGVSYAHQHKYTEAERALRRAIEIGTSETPHPRLSEFTGNLASLLAMLNQVEEAEEMHGQVLAIQIKERGSTHTSVGITLIHLADCEIRLKRYATAVRHAAEAIGILKVRLGEKHPRMGSAYFALATAYERLKRSDLAEPAIEAVMEIDKETMIDPSDRAAHLREYAVVMREVGKKSEAKAAEHLATEIDQQDTDAALYRETVDLKELRYH